MPALPYSEQVRRAAIDVIAYLSIHDRHNAPAFNLSLYGTISHLVPVWTYQYKDGDNFTLDVHRRVIDIQNRVSAAYARDVLDSQQEHPQ
jgi:hypothetical protein